MLLRKIRFFLFLILICQCSEQCRRFRDCCVLADSGMLSAAIGGVVGVPLVLLSRGVGLDRPLIANYLSNWSEGILKYLVCTWSIQGVSCRSLQLW